MHMVFGMNNTPVVSVITITRNRAPLLKRAIESVLRQTYRNFEYIIIDGASEDNTSDVVTSFKDNRIIYIKQEFNKDPRISVDDAIANARGQYITFLDDDDEYLPTKIEKQIKLIESLPGEYGLVYCWMDYYDEQKQKSILKWKPNLKGNIHLKLLEKQVISGTSSILLRTELIRNVGGWNKEVKYISDWELLIRISKISLIDFVPEFLVNVYINHSYIRQSKIQNNSQEVVTNLIDFHNYILTKYELDFRLNKQLKIHHLLIIAKSLKKLKKYKQMIITITKTFLINPLDIRIYKTMMKIFTGIDLKKIS